MAPVRGRGGQSDLVLIGCFAGDCWGGWGFVEAAVAWGTQGRAFTAVLVLFPGLITMMESGFGSSIAFTGWIWMYGCMDV